jgi:hypothetical protein
LVYRKFSGLFNDFWTNRSVFLVYRLVFPIYCLLFSVFIFQNFKSSQPVFSELIKPAWTAFLGFQKNRRYCNLWPVMPPTRVMCHCSAYRALICKAKRGGFKDTYPEDLLTIVLKVRVCLSRFRALRVIGSAQAHKLILQSAGCSGQHQNRSSGNW